MPITLTVQDQTTAGKVTDSITLEFLTERITVRELIRSRVYQEVQDHNLKLGRPGADAARAQAFRGLVQPEPTEAKLNAPRKNKPREIDWKAQFEVAVKAFEQNRVLVLVGDHQCESLEEEIVVDAAKPVAFMRLVPLVGG